MLEIGKQIKEAREKKNISQKDASRDTNINLSYIQAMEEGSTTFLPKVFIKNYYKMYAKYLKIDIEDTDLKISETKETVKVIEDDTPEPIIQIKKSIEKKKSKNQQFFAFINDRYKLINRTNLINAVIFVSIVIVIIVVFYFTLFYDSTDKKSLTTQDIQQVSNDKVIRSDSNSHNVINSEIKLIKLEARATDSVWIKMNIDDKRNEEVILMTNTARSWAAENYFIVSLSRAGAVEFWRDGILLPPLGKPYSKVNELKITKDSIIRKAYISDSARNAIRQANLRKQKQEPVPMFLTPSNIQKTSPFQDKKKDTVR